MNKIYFVHVPKTAGSFIKDCYGRYENFYPNTRNDREHKFPIKAKRLGSTCEAFRRQKDIDHFPSYQEDINYTTADFKFSVIRNPFDWLVSYYHHSSRYDNGWGNVNEAMGFKTFREFIISFATMPSENWHVPFLSSTPFGQILYKDRLMVDKYFKQENLFELHDYFLNNFDIRNSTNSRVNMSVKRKSKDYKNYYDQEMVDLIYKKMDRELKYFKYDFE